jgi:hypothetical protein
VVHVAALLDSINSSHGRHYRLGRALNGGESAAAQVVLDEHGNEYVLKWGEGGEFRMQEALVIAPRLHAVGYPAPKYVLSGDQAGVSFLIQKMLPGKPLGVLTLGYVTKILALNELQKDVAGDLNTNWPAPIFDSVDHGFREWCVHGSLAGYSSETALMLEELKAASAAVSGAEFRTADAVHFDFNPANILIDNGEISGVIDWNGCFAGDRAFDLTTLGFYAIEDESISAPLLARARQISGPGPVVLYLSHMILRQLDWSIRHHQPAVVQQYLSISRRALRMIRELRDQVPTALR